MRALFLMLILILVACGGSDSLLVEELRTEGSADIAVDSWSIDGKRDGASTRAQLAIHLQDGRVLSLNLLLAYNPEPILAEGTWELGSRSGRMEARSVRFVGGQGEGPSVGGEYELMRDDVALYRVRIPLSKIDPPAPSF